MGENSRIVMISYDSDAMTVLENHTTYQSGIPDIDLLQLPRLTGGLIDKRLVNPRYPEVIEAFSKHDRYLL